jgi:hypothetical protein
MAEGRSNAKWRLLPIQNILDDDLGELHHQLPQLLVFSNERVHVKMMHVGSGCRRVDLAALAAIRQVRISHAALSFQVTVGFPSLGSTVGSMRDSARIPAVAPHPGLPFGTTNDRACEMVGGEIEAE